MNEIDKWCAKQCGVEQEVFKYDTDIEEAWDYVCYLPEGIVITHCKWTIQDPRCREILRERFKLNTCIGAYGLFYCYNDETDYATDGTGKETIAEAEIACITAIWEARDE